MYLIIDSNDREIKTKIKIIENYFKQMMKIIEFQKKLLRPSSIDCRMIFPWFTSNLTL